MNIKICKDNEVLFENVPFAKGFFERLFGLMFQTRKRELIILNGNWIHTFFMRFSLDIVYIGKDFKILRVDKNISPFKILKPVWGAKYALEFETRPINLKKGDKIKLDEY